MARPFINRKVSTPPRTRSFSPCSSSKKEIEYLELKWEEYEAFKLVYYDDLNHLKASKHMEVSRPTFTRIFNSALKKISKAFVEAKGIKFNKGNAVLQGDWYECYNCDAIFTIPVAFLDKLCPICNTDLFTSF